MVSGTRQERVKSELDLGDDGIGKKKPRWIGVLAMAYGTGKDEQREEIQMYQLVICRKILINGSLFFLLQKRER